MANCLEYWEHYYNWRSTKDTLGITAILTALILLYSYSLFILPLALCAFSLYNLLRGSHPLKPEDNKNKAIKFVPKALCQLTSMLEFLMMVLNDFLYWENPS